MKTRNNQLAFHDPFGIDFLGEPLFGIAPFSLGVPKGMSPTPFGKCSCDIKETDSAFTVEAEFPGAAKEDIDISYDDDVLSIAYEKKEEKKDEQEDGSYLVRERSFASYKRVFRLPDVDVEGVSAKLEEGVLTIELPKKAEKETKTNISIG